MFKQISLPRADQPQTVLINVDGREISVTVGQSLAMALLGAGISPFRHTAVSGAPRAPLCLMGVCFDCLVEVDGSQNVQSCMVEVREGMRVRLPSGSRRVGAQT
ncbi:sarcosine oxidase alpha subunit (plasmid) [Cupriavidus necator N-1]|uniref:Sarcosine oxidase alpha subunit n=1 Tax=Cupriavidus necator (strain ATCC 43291 / DSM 13513 / CCUG 52238 / LMG 8453 / N-1) TaxID=1042878 RepID=F8GY20_CUPNN|nr:(2Fe-2S)-binding protein [Cupriavidus necator]AEI83144.1 sarcosine oxidase alpha subunit [Cupriavidus necator N-1]MDX6008551.1 (2Fe-2S)-binding protein [Cupriavidus necator]